MGTLFDYYNDGAFKLTRESQGITLTVTRTPTTATLNWNIPQSCSNNPIAYSGAIITVDTRPFDPPKTQPQYGVKYTADCTVNPNLFLGDMLDTAMVVGAMYFDTTTTTFTITDLDDSTPYYFSLFPVDNEFRYYNQGVHGYSQPWKLKPIAGQAGFQVVTLGQTGVNATDSTGLQANQNYVFNLSLNYVSPGNNITVSGANSQTYQDLMDQMQSQFALLNNPLISSTPPNYGSLYILNNNLSMWDGYSYQSINFVISNEIPNTTDYQYWYNTTTNQLLMWENNQWVPVINMITYPTDPTIPACNDYWNDGTSVSIFNGATWVPLQTIYSLDDPSQGVTPNNCNLIWLYPENFTLYNWNNFTNGWEQIPVLIWNVNPNNPSGGYWYSTTLNQLYCWNYPFPGWNPINCEVTSTTPSSPSGNQYWLNPTTNALQVWNATSLQWVSFEVIVQPNDPTILTGGEYWFNPATLELFQWDFTYDKWIQVNYINSQTNPALAPTLSTNTVWVSGSNSYMWDSQWVEISCIDWPVDPRLLANNTIWLNTTTSTYNIRSSGQWEPLNMVTSAYDISVPPDGVYWYNPSSGTLSQWNSTIWNPVPYSTTLYQPGLNSLWFNTSSNTLMSWNGKQWEITNPPATVTLDTNGNMRFTSGKVDGMSFVALTDINLFKTLAVYPTAYINPGMNGADEIDPVPMYEREGVGTDGNPNIRNELADEIRTMLGYPVVNVELTQQQLDLAINIALSAYRQRTGAAYRRGYLFLRLLPNTQTYILSNKGASYDRIVTVIQLHRMTSAFMSTANGAGVFGQVVIQQLYNMGTYDLLSYYMITQYVETMELLFAGRLTFTWDERNRRLDIFQTIQTPEVVTMEVAVERSEQDIITDRWCRNWIRRFSLAQSRLMLAEIRGKYQSLPGAGGSITMDANELRATSKEEMDLCYQELDEYVIENLEEYGSGSVVVMG